MIPIAFFSENNNYFLCSVCTFETTNIYKRLHFKGNGTLSITPSGPFIHIFKRCIIDFRQVKQCFLPSWPVYSTLSGSLAAMYVCLARYCYPLLGQIRKVHASDKNYKLFKREIWKQKIGRWSSPNQRLGLGWKNMYVKSASRNTCKYKYTIHSSDMTMRMPLT